MKQRIYVGLDGGASKTEVAIVDGAGRVLGFRRFDRGCAIIGAPNDRSCACMCSAVRAACRDARLDPDACLRSGTIGIGLSGIDFADEYAMQFRAISRALGISRDRLELVNDAVVALWGATSAASACLIQHGTEQTAAVRAGLGSERVFDSLDVGRLFDIRRESLVQVARMIDGRAESTPLKTRILRGLGVVRQEEFSERVYRKQLPPDNQATLTRIVYESWQRGDHAATLLVKSAIADYALLAKAMLACVGALPGDVAVGGGVITAAPDRFWHLLEAALRRQAPRARLCRPTLPPAHGAALMAAHRNGRDLVALFKTVAEQVDSSPTNTRRAS